METLGLSLPLSYFITVLHRQTGSKATLVHKHGNSVQWKAVAAHSSAPAWRIPRQRSLVGCSPWGHEESGTTEQLHFHFSLSCIGEGNGNPLQCSCLENPRDGGAWWAAVYGVAQSRTRLKRLSSSSSSRRENWSTLPAQKISIPHLFMN